MDFGRVCAVETAQGTLCIAAIQPNDTESPTLGQCVVSESHADVDVDHGMNQVTGGIKGMDRRQNGFISETLYW